MSTPARVSLRAPAVVFGGTIFLSAFLLFQVQLIVSKYILPWFGGSAAVWTTSMLVYQVLLLLGYVYAHVLSEKFSRPAQFKTHLGILTLACGMILALSVLWPSAITPGGAWKTRLTANPVLDVILVLLVSSGLPFFVLSTTGPLLQRWFADIGGDARTYRLYAVSNLGSLLGLLAFPFALEPLLRITIQGRLWALLFSLFAVGCGWCAWRARTHGQELECDAANAEANAPVTSALRLLWLLLAACASAALLSTTNLLCQEITSIPLLWVLPLALYVLSFILCFDHPRWYQRAIFHPLFAAGIFAFWLTARFALRTPQVLVMPLLLFVACMICHGELVRVRPAVKQLTSFYLAVSLGGALGGVFVAVIAPQIFHFFTEYQLSLGTIILLLLVCLYRDDHSWLHRTRLLIPVAITICGLGTAYLCSRWVPPLSAVLDSSKFYPLALLAGFLTTLGTYLQTSRARGQVRKFHPGQILVALLAILALGCLYETAQPEPGLYAGKRNFYGALRVYELAQGGKALFHGQTLHGAQLNPPNNFLPMAYYGPESGIGIFLRNHPRPANGLRVGVVGLGAGTLAAYGMPGDSFRYYEINPDVIALSSGTSPVFTYLRDSRASVEVRAGDARLLLENELHSPSAPIFDVLVLDAFSGDAVPVHLLTTQAFDTYWKHLDSGHGVIAIHVSSRHINLMPVINGITAHYGLTKLECFTEANYPFLDSLWVFLAKNPDDLQIDGLYSNPSPLPANLAPQLWTDDYSNIVRLLY